MTATWTKLREGFGVRVSGGTPTPGQTLTVAKKSGGTSTATIGRILWTGKDKFSGDQIVLCTIASEARYGSYATIGQRQNARMARTGWTGCSCGSIEGNPRSSDCASCQHDY